jgi:hypothetical protein
MSATEALDAYLEKLQSSSRASSGSRAADKPHEPPKTTGASAARSSKAPEGTSRLRLASKGPLLKGCAAKPEEGSKTEAIKAVWPPGPLDERDERPLLRKTHPATCRAAQRKLTGTNSGEEVLASPDLACFMLQALVIILCKRCTNYAYTTSWHSPYAGSEHSDTGREFFY